MANAEVEVDCPVVGIRLKVPAGQGVNPLSWGVLPKSLSGVELIIQSPTSGVLALYDPVTDTLRKHDPANRQEPVRPVQPKDAPGDNNPKKK
jgi:hypothetical protein